MFNIRLIPKLTARFHMSPVQWGGGGVKTGSGLARRKGAKISRGPEAGKQGAYETCSKSNKQGGSRKIFVSWMWGLVCVCFYEF